MSEELQELKEHILSVVSTEVTGAEIAFGELSVSVRASRIAKVLICAGLIILNAKSVSRWFIIFCRCTIICAFG